MSLIFLVLFVVLIAYLSLLFLSKKYPDYFPKNVLFRTDSVIFLFLSIVILYITIASLVLGLSEVYKQNDINCYKGHFFYKSTLIDWDTCPVILNNFSQQNFLVVSFVSFLSFIVLVYFFSKKNNDLIKVLFQEVDLFKEKKDRKIGKGFLAIVIPVTIIIIIIGYIFFTNL